jgi:hypothetical protein
VGAPLVAWSADGKAMFVSLQYFGFRSRNTLLLPTRPGERPPNLTHGKLRTDAEFSQLPGAKLVHDQDVFPGANGSIYATSRRSAQTNIYRVTLP